MVDNTDLINLLNTAINDLQGVVSSAQNALIVLEQHGVPGADVPEARILEVEDILTRVATTLNF